jgi:hypothetical protein
MKYRKMKFFERKILDLQTAIFSNDSRSILKLPTSVIHLSVIDEDGSLLFTASKLYQDISDMDRSFPAELQFYHKDFRYYVKVTGMAAVNTDDPGNKTNPDVLVRMSPGRIEYFKIGKNKEADPNLFFTKLLRWLWPVESAYSI